MERSVTVRTPESIAFHYELAGLGSRFLAILVDLVFQTFLAVGVVIIYGYTASGINRFLTALHVKPAQMDSVLTAITVFAMFAIYFGYFIAFEALWSGQTPGKRVIGIRVVRDGGYPIGFSESVIRNLIRVLEALLFFYASSAISAVISAQNKRLGDLAAGTIVVRDRGFEVTDPKRWLEGDGDAEPAMGIAGASALSPDELELVDRYISRRSQLLPDIARGLAQRVAAAVRPKLGADARDLDDDELLMRIAVARRR